MISGVEESYAKAASRLFLLDYDGTLSPIKPTPPLAKPTSALLRLLSQLADDPKNRVVIISGRDHETLDKWLGRLRLDFAAEHGALVRTQGQAWQLLHKGGSAWKKKAKLILKEFSGDISGSFIEEKTASLAWHYRMAADSKQARQVALKLLKSLQPMATAEDLTLLDGNKVVEVKLAGMDKGKVAQSWLKKRKWDFILAAGDDTTDEDLFKAMPAKAYSIKIGQGQSSARSRLENPMSLRALLKKLASQ